MTDNKKYDYVVVGGGVFGLSTALYFAINYPQVKIALVQQFKIGHDEGSSHSQTRIIRSTYFKAIYRDLCVQGIDKNWPQVQSLLKEKFIVPNSCLFYIEDQTYFPQFEQVAKTSKGQIQLLPLDKVKELFPSAPTILLKQPVFHDKKAGVVYAEKYIKGMAKFLGSYSNLTIFEQTSVENIENNEKGVKLICKNKNGGLVIETKKASLSCGRWIGKLIPQMKKITKEVRQTPSFWLMNNPQSYNIGKYPSWVHLTKDTECYSLPDYENVGIKFSHHTLDEDISKQFPTQAQYQQFMIKFFENKMNQYFKGRFNRMNKIQKCYYTVTKTEDFVIDWSDQHENILIVSPCSGHGFKFGPIIGRIVADLLVKDQSTSVFEEGRHNFRLFYHLGIDLRE